MKGVNPLSLGKVYFQDAELGDARRTRRLVQLFDEMTRHPGGTLPEKLSEPRDLRAFYRIMNAEDVTHQAIMQGHYAATAAAIQATLEDHAAVLVIHDATELDYATINVLRDQLGQIGDGSHRGDICHNSLAVRADTKEVLGLTSQILHHRADVPKRETDKARRERENRESRLWVRGAEASGAPVQSGLVVDVSDSLSDTFEYMYYEHAHDRHFVLRARENRKLHVPINGQQYLEEGVRSWRSRHTYSIDCGGNGQRPARKAQVNISYGQVVIAPPGARSGEYEEVPLTLWAVRVWEPRPPAGEEPLEWILLTNVPVDKLEDATTRVAWYEDRFIIEDYHKGQKTGCGIETMQFDTIQRLEPAIGVLSILATTLLKLRDAARRPDAELRPATDVVDEIYVRVLRLHYPKRLSRNPSIKQFYMHVARLGGHQNRKVDGFPGWITLWRGWMKLEAMVAGYRLSQRKQKRCGTN
jgi:hypothetical protein